ncbi:hypothetical protein VitviT2T_013875 [Vitis vinifera]|uniref:OTU domain-containing protein n=1 Tax=Vitis vinifera TaxID=29760 RepID=A0ABY9CKQ8_VITVI|nr:hypothetical protein VitviT2T_013875 [Vitis vinifera]
MLSLCNISMKTTKGSQSIAEYMQIIKIIIDDFALMGYPLSEDEIILHVLNGLGNEFKEINVVIRARDSPVTFEGLHDKLQDEETFLKQDGTKLWLSFWSEVHYNSLYASGDVPSRAPRKRHSPAQDHLFSVPIPSPC